MKNKVLFLGLIVAMLFAVACKSDIDNKPVGLIAEATASEVTNITNTERDTPSRLTLDFNTQKSSIGWVGAKVTGDHVGGFNSWEGKAVVENKMLESMEFTVDTRSIFSDNERLTGHLKSGDFFDVEKYPEAKFISTSIVAKKEANATHLITGNFTIRGVTRSITFPATISVDNKSVKATTEFTINRFDFGIEYAGMPDDLIRKEVLLKINLVTS